MSFLGRTSAFAALLMAFVALSPPARAQQDEAAKLEARVKELNDAGKFADALPLAKRVLAIREKALKPEDPKIADALADIAELSKSLKRPTEAEPLFRR